MSLQAFCRQTIIKTEELRKVEEDIIHIIIRGAREGSGMIKHGLKLATMGWQRAGLLTLAFEEGIVKQLVDWQVMESSVAYQVYAKARDIAKATTAPLEKNGEILLALRDVTWLETLITEAKSSPGEQQPPRPSRQKLAGKGRLKRDSSLIAQDNEMGPANKKKKPAVTHTRQSRHSSRVKKDEEEEKEKDKRPPIFGLDELKLEDHAEVRNAVPFWIGYQ